MKSKLISLNLRGCLKEYSRPLVMGILNVTPDSFYASSRKMDCHDIRRQVVRMIDDGVDIIDIGGYSSRPGADDIDAGEELRRVMLGLEEIRRISTDVIVSVDTFRSEVARRSVVDYGADIVNDISGGDADPEMWATVADLKVPYVLMHMRGTPVTMQSFTDYGDVTADVIRFLSEKLRKLRLMGVADVIIDPGFGFGKTLEQNYKMMCDLRAFELSLGAPILVGISRKSMITKVIGQGPEDALAGTVALNMFALERGASILRVHDVKEAVDCVKIFSMLGGSPL